jgi:hypothetical protein
MNDEIHPTPAEAPVAYFTWSYFPAYGSGTGFALSSQAV